MRHFSCRTMIVVSILILLLWCVPTVQERRPPQNLHVLTAHLLKWKKRWDRYKNLENFNWDCITLSFQFTNPNMNDFIICFSVQRSFAMQDVYRTFWLFTTAYSYYSRLGLDIRVKSIQRRFLQSRVKMKRYTNL